MPVYHGKLERRSEDEEDGQKSVDAERPLSGPRLQKAAENFALKHRPLAKLKPDRGIVGLDTVSVAIQSNIKKMDCLLQGV